MFSRNYSAEPADPAAFTARFDAAYSRFARLYDVAVRRLPVWKTWLLHALPHIRGPRVLEISFGTGYLLSQYVSRFQCIGLDINPDMIQTASKNLKDSGGDAPLLRGNAQALPFAENSFDCVVNTMAFSGYPDGAAALSEMRRVLKPEGRLVLLDIGYPSRNRPAGILLTNLWKYSGDLIRDLPALLAATGFVFTDTEVGGFGSVHLYVAQLGE
jgi:ubiquinone/menaquinone biosynthesis C-methylase UbiE